MGKRLSILVLLLLSLSVFGQQDSTYIEDYRDYANISLALERKAHTISIYNHDGNPLRLSTNNGFPTYGIMFNYKWINAWATTSLGSLSPDIDRRGETDNLGLAVGYTGDHWWARVFYERYNGYHIANPESYAPNWFDNNDQYPQLPNLRSTTIYANAYYGFNDETYSHRALLWQSQAQRKSAGSWLMGVSLGYDHIYTDSAFIPADAVYDYWEIRNVTGYETTTAAVNLGYTHHFAFYDHWSLGLMFAPGVAATYGQVEEEGGGTRAPNFHLSAMSETRVLLSYHRDRWFGGLAANVYMLTKPIRGEFFNSTHSYIRFNVGYRLAMPKSKFLGHFGLSN